jgi:hypothetical protein
MATVVLYKPKSEIEAQLLKGYLEGDGLFVVLRSYQLPMYDSIGMMMKPDWGEILVAEEDLPRAQELLAAFFAEAEEEKKTND